MIERDLRPIEKSRIEELGAFLQVVAEENKRMNEALWFSVVKKKDGVALIWEERQNITPEELKEIIEEPQHRGMIKEFSRNGKSLNFTHKEVLFRMDVLIESVNFNKPGELFDMLDNMINTDPAAIREIIHGDGFGFTPINSFWPKKIGYTT